VDNLVSSCNSFRVRTRFDDEKCSIARSLEVLGDWWTLLVVREAFLGTRRFADFETNLGISKNILSARLDHLVTHGVLAKVDAGVHGTRFEYELTAMGKDLVMVMTALRQWGDRWIFGEGNEPVLVVDRRTGKPIPRQIIRGEDGTALRGKDLEVRLGPNPPDRRRRA
jgi:DNA-binding HxlR family transcriptional regulator